MVHIDREPTAAGAAVLRMNGDIDMNSSPQVRDALLGALGESDVRVCIVVLTDVSYMDSSGIATFVEGLQTCKKTGKQMHLAALSPAVRDVFELARLNNIFSIFPDVAAAREAAG